MPPSIAVIGAGIAGLACASKLRAQGHQVRIFEKSRGLSGRCSTRKINHSTFDHGAQFFTAKSAVFQDFVAAGLQQGVISPWQPRCVTPPTSQPWYVAAPGMSAISAVFEHIEDIQTQSEVVHSHFKNMSWELHIRTQEKVRTQIFDDVIFAIPAPQAALLLHQVDPRQLPQADTFTAHLHLLASIEMLPCWTIMLNDPAQQLRQWPFDVYQCPPDEIATQAIAWLANNSSKPHRNSLQESAQWIIQATPNWSIAHLNDQPDTIITSLLQELERLVAFPVTSAPLVAVAHRWKFAHVQVGTERMLNCLWDNENHFGLCGDYFSTSRIESAYLSGITMADAYCKNASTQFPSSVHNS